MAGLKQVDGEINLKGWGWEEIVVEAINEAIIGTFKDSAVYAYFEAEMQKEIGRDWTQISIVLPLGSTDNDDPKFVFSLREMVMDVLEGNQPGDGSPWPEGEDKAAIRQLPVTLRELADLVDAELNRTDNISSAVSPESDSAP